jgi:glycosyltransferase involved in cell wall biosynthesis
VVVELAAAHRRAGHRSMIICFGARGPLADLAEREGVRVCALGRKPGPSLRSFTALAGVFRRYRPDIIQTHGCGLHHYGAAASRLAGAPVLVNTRHGTGALHASPRQDAVFRAALPFTDMVVCCSEDLRRYVVKEKGIPESRTLVIRNGIRLERFEPGPKRPTGRPVRFGTVGNLRGEKAHTCLVDAFAEVARMLPDSTLRIVGHGPLRGDLERQIRTLGLSRQVKLEGDWPDAAPFYREIDLFVLSSVTEGLPLVVLEAMASGLPIVSTRVGGVPEVAPEGQVATYCPVGDSHALAQAMREAATSPHRLERGEEAVRIARRDFSIEAFQRSYQRLFRQLTRSRSPGQAADHAQTYSPTRFSPPSGAHG